MEVAAAAAERAAPTQATVVVVAAVGSNVKSPRPLVLGVSRTELAKCVKDRKSAVRPRKSAKPPARVMNLRSRSTGVFTNVVSTQPMEPPLAWRLRGAEASRHWRIVSRTVVADGCALMEAILASARCGQPPTAMVALGSTLRVVRLALRQTRQFRLRR